MSERSLNITYNGESKSLKDWAKELGIKYITLYNRIYTYGYSIEKAFGDPVKAPHGHSRKDSEYNAWSDMKARCFTETHKSYDRYGGRGITVCERWKDSFPDFLSDMGKRPSPGLSLDRIDNNGNYEPGNCRWASRKEQARNTSKNRVVEYNGREYCMVDLREKLQLPRQTIEDRIDKGMSAQEAIDTPIKPHRIFLTHDGETKMLSQWGEKFGISIGCIQERLQKGWSIKAALETPSLKRKLVFNGEAKTAGAWAKQYGISRATLKQRLEDGWSLEDALTWPKWKKHAC